MDEIVNNECAQEQTLSNGTEAIAQSENEAVVAEAYQEPVAEENTLISSEEVCRQQEMDKAAVEAAVLALAQREEQTLEAMSAQDGVEIVIPEQEEEIVVPQQESEQAAPAQETPEFENINLKAIVEALLFVQGGSVSIDKIQEIVSHSKVGSDDKKIEKKTLREILEELQKEYNERNSAIQIVEVAGGWQFCTREEFSLWLEKLAKHKEVYKLSNSALETLSIIAYKQPITRAEVEHVRGVDSGGVIHNLLEKRLIRIAGRKECIGHPLLYGTTNEFLQYFGLATVSDLPLLEDLNRS